MSRRMTYEDYEKQFDPLKNDRQARRKRKSKIRHIAKRSETEIINDIAAVDGLEGGFHPTYQPSRYEGGWLISALTSFYEQSLITDIEALVKGGKEASVYRCTAHPSTGEKWLAAKVYRPRMFRSLSNDAMYREGRQTLTSDGRAVKTTDHRTMRAIGKKTAFGEEVAHTSWLMHEFVTLKKLYLAGAAVPQALGTSENAILMSYLGDEHIAAPLLSEVSLEQSDAERLFHEVLRNIDLMLQHQAIHGDLSAYNILYWNARITLIDFPQVTNLSSNSNARFILQRDIQRICEYFGRQSVDTDATTITNDFVQRYQITPPAGIDEFEAQFDD